MASGYRELLEQLQGLTQYDGFLSALVDIRDSMVFYDRDLMLASYTGAVEGLIVSALASACLEGDREAGEAFDEVRRIVDQLPQRLDDPQAPPDVEAVVESFLRVGAWILRERVRLFITSFSRYVTDDYDLEQSVDALVLRAQQTLARDPDQCLEQLGEVGALMLRGHLLRRHWLEVAEPRLQLWLAGLRNMVGQVAATYPTFPWRSVDEERKRPHTPPAVVDLQAFRRRRFMAQETWQWPEGEQPQDDVDRLMEKLFQGPQALDPPALEAFERLGEQAVPLLVAAVNARHLLETGGPDVRAVVAAIRVLAHLRRHEVLERLVELAAAPEVPKEVAREAREALERLGGLAVDGVSEYLRRTSEVPAGGAALARLLARMPRSEKTFRTLVELFQRLRWEDDAKAAAAAALAEYGDGRALPVLQQALRDPQLPAGRVRWEIEGAVRRLTGHRSSRRRRVAKG
ncbi:MAG: DUF2150 family protein [Limnochordaceae bacterium]|nr:DUF2150 family protein [Limnochordaceae bacterium]